MKKYIFLAFCSLLFVSCATKNGEVTNRDLLAAMTENNKAITALAISMTTNVEKKADKSIPEPKSTRPQLGKFFSKEQILGTAPKKSTIKTPAVIASPSATDKDIAALKRRVSAIEKSDKEQDHDIASIMTAQKKLGWKISQIGMENFNNFIVGKFFHKSSYPSKEILGQVRAVAETLNREDDGASHTVNVTGYDDNGKISDKRGEAIRAILSKHLKDNISVSLNREGDTKKDYARCVFISNPFKR